MKQTLVRKLKYDGRLKSAWQGDLLPAPAGWLAVLHHVRRDEADFARNRAATGYPAEVAVQARRGIEAARRLVAKRLFPFDETVIYLGEECR